MRGLETGFLTHYEVLELERNADKATITKQYRELALIWSPDRASAWAPTSAVPDLTLISSYLHEAYNCLRDDNKRRDYDMAFPAALDKRDAEFRLKKAALKPIYEAYVAAKENPKAMLTTLELLSKQLQGYLMAQVHDTQKSTRLEKENDQLTLEVAELKKALAAAEELATPRIQTLETELAQSRAQVAILQKQLAESQRNRTEAPVVIPSGAVFVSETEAKPLPGRAAAPAAEAKTFPAKKLTDEAFPQNKPANPQEAAKKISLKGLMYVVREVAIPVGKKEMSFSSITLIFSTREEGLAAQKDLNIIGLTIGPTKQEKMGAYENDSRFYRLILMEGATRALAKINPELEALLILDMLERGALISSSQKRIFDMSTGKFIFANLASKRELQDLECIVLSTGKFLSETSKSFAGVTLIFNNAEAVNNFQKAIGFSELSTTKPRVNSIVNFQNQSRFVDLTFKEHSQLDSLSKANPHLTGLLLLALLENSFEISEHEKVLYDEEKDAWLLQKGPQKTSTAQAGLFSGGAPAQAQKINPQGLIEIIQVVGMEPADPKGGLIFKEVVLVFDNSANVQPFVEELNESVKNKPILLQAYTIKSEAYRIVLGFPKEWDFCNKNPAIGAYLVMEILEEKLTSLSDIPLSVYNELSGKVIQHRAPNPNRISTPSLEGFVLPVDFDKKTIKKSPMLIFKTFEYAYNFKDRGERLLPIGFDQDGCVFSFSVFKDEEMANLINANPKIAVLLYLNAFERVFSVHRKACYDFDYGNWTKLQDRIDPNEPQATKGPAK